jgi:hypothetical protein
MAYKAKTKVGEEGKIKRALRKIGLPDATPDQISKATQTFKKRGVIPSEASSDNLAKALLAGTNLTLTQVAKLVQVQEKYRA